MDESRVDKWKKGWEAGWIDFHMPKVNHSLVKYYGKLTGGKKGLRFFIPLCGKTLDMKWLSDQGQEVVGVEGVEMACEQFFQEQNMKYSVSDIPGIPDGKLFTGESGKIKLYKCDALAITSALVGKFDAIWDRGSLVAMDPPDRAGYIKMLKDVSKPGTNILAEIYEYDWDQRIKQHAPYPFFRQDVDDIFASWADVSEEERYDKIDEKSVFREWGLTWMTNIVYIMKSKV
ncbi:putative thiopurine S-methyltransferase [Apostichopus japonicus]|uniref:thiopurine S-methyltransferase n=1 Tax=Stichopus japonicus TaxID=307972 RepID=A0A2G8JLK8_STIJA|nr:putative thiopurine S-methyltransferase [Apostichopus japonicus]